MSKLIQADFNNTNITFNSDAWFNATEVAAMFGKRPVDWLTMESTKQYISDLSSHLKCDQSSLLKSKRGNNGGTWLHPKLAIRFAQWLDNRFAIWCDEQIENIIHGNKQQIDWNLMRHASKSTNKVANQILQMVRAEQGKNTEPHHYANEAKLVNWVLTGEFKPVDRDALSLDDLNLLANLENRNSVLLGRGVDRETRKEILKGMAFVIRTPLLAA
jgi:hypothetical protein